MIRNSVLGVLFVGWCMSATAASYNIDRLGRFTFQDPSNSQLSGISWLGNDPSGDNYFAVSDKSSLLIPLSISLNRSSGAILAVGIGAAIQLRGSGTDSSSIGTPLTATDQEGVAYDRATNTVLVANENAPEIRRHDIGTGNTLSSVIPGDTAPLNVYRGMSNSGWESVAISALDGSVWTSNEQDLPTDPERVVRLQQFDAQLAPLGQFAYEIDPDPSDPFVFKNGVSDLEILEDGSLLVLERAASSSGYRIRLYRVDFTGASDLKGGALADNEPVGKELIFEEFSPLFVDNYEGMTLGPPLDGGKRSLMLIADNNGLSEESTLLSLSLTTTSVSQLLLPTWTLLLLSYSVPLHVGLRRLGQPAG